MRSWIKSIPLMALGVALANTATAAGTTEGSFGFALSTFPPVSAYGFGPGSGGVGADLTVTLGATPFGTTVRTGAAKIRLASTAAPPLSALSIKMLAPTNCTFSAGGGGGGGLGGPCGLGGTINALVGGAPYLVVPASPIGGSARLTFGPYGSYIDPNVWTTGVASITINGVPLTTGNATTPGAVITMAGYDNRSASYARRGNVKLVAPAGLMSTLGGPIPLFVSMTLAVNVYDGEWIPVPEPGILLLLGSASLGLGLLARKKQKESA